MTTKIQREPMPLREPKQRVKDFSEVALGITEEQARREAARCLRCKRPVCSEACPVGIDIPGFIAHIVEGNYKRAAELIKKKNNLPAICGRVCPQEDLCEKSCTLSKKGEPVSIGALERFVADWEISQMANGKWQIAKDFDKRQAISDKRKVAVVGSGPAGLSCAADLARAGFEVTIFESLHAPGGVLTYGIPEFRLPKQIVATEIEHVEGLGVEIRLNMVIGKVFDLKDLLQQGYSAVFMGTGAGLPQFLGIEGENLNRVYSANEFLTRINLMKAYLFPEFDTPINIGKRIAVIGAGNVAMDAARCALRLGAEEVIIVYRRSEQQMPARKQEIENARDEGVRFQLLSAPVKIEGENGFVRGLLCVKMELGSPDESGRRRPIPIKGSGYFLKADTVVVAIGQRPNPLLLDATEDLQIRSNGTVDVDKSTGRTSLNGVFAGGDIATGAETVISAMGAGKRAAEAIIEYVRSGTSNTF